MTSKQEVADRKYCHYDVIMMSSSSQEVASAHAQCSTTIKKAAEPQTVGTCHSWTSIFTNSESIYKGLWLVNIQHKLKAAVSS